VVRSEVIADPPEFRVGQKVTVYYDPQHPQTARIDSWRQLWVGALMWIVLGSVFGLVGAWPLLRLLLRAQSHGFGVARLMVLKHLHRLGAASLVWDAYPHGDGPLKIRGLHLEDAAGHRVRFRGTWTMLAVYKQKAYAIAEDYSAEPGHYVLALPKGPAISTPQWGRDKGMDPNRVC
jgi:hypothetical protein